MAFNPPSIEEIIDREKTYIKEVLKSLNPTDQNAFCIVCLWQWLI